MQQKPTADRENPLLAPHKNNSIDIKDNQQVIKSTVIRRTRTMGVDPIKCIY